MTIQELVQAIMTNEDLRVYFKQIEERMVLIFWKGSSPIASVFVDEFDYNIDYPKLYEMDLYEILEIDQALYDFTQTPIDERDL